MNYLNHKKIKWKKNFPIQKKKKKGSSIGKKKKNYKKIANLQINFYL